MKHMKWLTLLMAGAMAFSVFSLAACDFGNSNQGDNPNQGENPNQGNNPNQGENPNQGNTDKTPAASGVICYDNLPDDGISLSEADTKFTAPKGLDTSAFTLTGASDYTKIATYDANTGVFTAVGAGSIIYKDANGGFGKLTVAPAYVENPGNQYTKLADDKAEATSTLLGNTHDPSFIEVTNPNTGATTYYLFSTGWYNTTQKGSATYYGNAIHSSTDLLTWKYEGRTFNYKNRDEEFVNTKAGKWLYDGTHNGYDDKDAGWWAPDIVPCPTGGYWLYTCVVDGAGDSEGMMLPGGNYARACILLYYSQSVMAGSFKPVKDNNGDPVVLMQSSIKRGEKEADVNGIDPQIIYDTDGKMYMAYGSFGSGNYMIELDPQTGMRKDGKGWQTHDEIRSYVNDIQDDFESISSDNVGYTHDYYGRNISKANMEAPVIARHDNVTIMDENETLLEGSGKTYYYTMHSYDGLGDNYQMWGGRSEDVWGIYRSVGGGVVRNTGINSSSNSGNKYMGAFKWADKSAGVTEYDIMLPGHNDLYTTNSGVDLAAYITRISYSKTDNNSFLTQVHQYYLNSLGHIVINPNRYSLEVNRSVSEEELLKYTKKDDKGYEFKMVVMINHRDTESGDFSNIQNVSRNVYLTAEHTITEENGTKIGTWKMYGGGYIKFTFDATLKGTKNADSGNKEFYGVVRPAWLGDQNKSGFTITTLGSDANTTRSMAMFMNNYSTLTGGKLEG